MNPQRTATGWKIDVNALCQLLRFRYYWLPEQEWWRLYIDARNYGGSKTCTIELSILNNEAMLNDVGFHSPDHYWPVHLMYGDDSRENLDLNLGGSDNYLNSWVSETQEAVHNVYLSADSVCMDSILGNGLVATSTDKFNAYNYETVQTRSEVGTTGFRSGVNREICREHPESLLPALPTEHLILCSNHMMSRVTEHLVKNTILSVLDEETNKRITAPEKEARLQHFVENIYSRGVRSGQFKIKFDGNKLEPITLNTTHAETISSPPELIGPEYRHIIDNVISDDLYEQPLPRHLQEALNLDSPLISKKELEKIIWDTHWKMHVICGKDPDPRLRENVNVEAYRFGLEVAEICEYQRLADLFHALVLFRYGPMGLVPYMIKRVDIVPILLRDLPWHGLMRGSTEGGERSHYRDQVWFYGHSSRGGVWTKSDPVLNVFLLMYRRLREQMRDLPKHIQEKFEKFVTDRLSAAEVTDHSTEANEAQFAETEPHLVACMESPQPKKLKRGEESHITAALETSWPTPRMEPVAMSYFEGIIPNHYGFHWVKLSLPKS